MIFKQDNKFYKIYISRIVNEILVKTKKKVLLLFLINSLGIFQARQVIGKPRQDQRGK